MRDKVNDVAFISALLDKLESKYKINIDRVYATGMSNGAIMSYRLACELPDRFAAIAPVAGTLFVGCDSTTPVSDGCPDQPTTTKAGAVNTTTWSPCRAGTAVKLITVDGAGHQWPGGQQMAKILDKPTTALDAPSVIWKFFKDHPKKH